MHVTAIATRFGRRYRDPPNQLTVKQCTEVLIRADFTPTPPRASPHRSTQFRHSEFEYEHHLFLELVDMPPVA